MARSRPIHERLAARYPLLYVISGDEPDARQVLRKAGMARGLKVIEPRYGRADLQDAACDAIEALVAATERSAVVLPLGHRLLTCVGFVQLLAEHLRAIEKAGHAVVMLAANDVPSPELDRDRVVLYLPLPGADELRPLVEAAFRPSVGGAADPRTVELALEAAKGMTSVQLRRALRRVRLSHPEPDMAAVAELHAEKRDLVAHGGLLDVVAEPPTLADVGGMDNLKAWLGRRRRALSEQARSFGLPAPRGVLLIGVQGCGKSLFAKAVADAFGLPLLRFDLGRLFTRDSAPDENLRHALAVTEAMAPAVLWVDELDKAFSGAMNGSDTTARIFGTFITWLAEQRDGVFVAATANRVDRMPAELMRKGRFDETFFVDLPNADVRAEILAIHLRRSGRDANSFDMQAHARAGERLTGAELEQAVVEALAVAFEEGRELADGDINRALRETVPFVETYEKQVKELREWARRRARHAGRDQSLRELFLEARHDDGGEPWRE